jgi:hypothetical protein
MNRAPKISTDPGERSSGRREGEGARESNSGAAGPADESKKLKTCGADAAGARAAHPVELAPLFASLVYGGSRCGATGAQARFRPS